MKPLFVSASPAVSLPVRQNLIPFALGVALSGSGLPGGGSALALGLIAAAEHRLSAIFAFAGAAVGGLLLLDFSHSLRILAAGFLILTASHTLHPLLTQYPALAPLLASLLTASVEFVYAVQDGMQEIAYCLLTVLLTGVSTVLFRPLFAGEQGRSRSMALGTVLVGCLLTLCRFSLAQGIVPARSLGFLAILLMAYCCGSSVGGCFGFAFGFCLDLCSGEGFLCTAVCGLGGLLGGLRARAPRVSGTLFFLLPSSLLLLTQQTELAAPLLFELLLAGLSFLLLPMRLLRRLLRRAAPYAAAHSGEQELRERLQTQLSESAAAFRELSQSFKPKVEPSSENPAILFDRTAEQVCRGCALCAYCWEQEYNTTYNALNDATPLLLQRGEAKGEDFPEHFSHRCIHFSRFLAAVNEELRAYQLRKRCRSQVAAAQQSTLRQWEQLSALLDSAADHLRAGSVRSVSTEHCRLGAALRPKQGQSVSGDSLSTFRTAGGQLCLLLCDGMGSGEAARRESAMALRLLERFLHAGIAPQVALQTLNQALALPTEGQAGFTTVDLLYMEPGTGQAVLYKYGAAPTYLLQNGRVRRITCCGLPAGLNAHSTAPEETRLYLQEGSLLVMVTDGLSSGGMDDLWLQDLLARWEGTDPQALATWILAESRRYGGLEDDCGVVVLSVQSVLPTAEVA